MNAVSVIASLEGIAAPDRLGQILVCLVEGLAWLAAEPEPGRDHAVCRHGQLPGQIMEPGELAVFGVGAALRVVFGYFGGEVAANLHSAADDGVRVASGSRRGCWLRGGSMCRARNWPRSVRPSSELPWKILSSTKENGRSRLSDTSHREIQNRPLIVCPSFVRGTGRHRLGKGGSQYGDVL
jgi:hypothetical protein